MGRNLEELPLEVTLVLAWNLCGICFVGQILIFDDARNEMYLVDKVKYYLFVLCHVDDI